MNFDDFLNFNSRIFHSGIYYISVSIIFILATSYGLKVLIDIRKELRKLNESSDND
jgi:hypothetical protein